MGIDYTKDKNYLEDFIKKLEEGEAAYYFREAWKNLYNEYPSDRTLGTLWAKSCLETGVWKAIHCNNFGNIKRKSDELFTMFKCGEEVSLKQAEQLIKDDPDLISIRCKYKWSNGSKRASIIVLPGHKWSQFKAYRTPIEGAEGYIKFVSSLSRYKKAWQELVKGNPEQYSLELGKAGYYTADPKKYTKTVMNRFNYFMKHKDELLSWQPPIEEEAKTIPTPPPFEEDKDTIPMDQWPSIVEDQQIPLDYENPPPQIDDYFEESTKISNVKTKATSVMVVLASFVGFIIYILQSCM